MTDKTEMFRMIPAVDRLLESPFIEDIKSRYPRSLILKAVNEVLDNLREGIESGKVSQDSFAMSLESISREVAKRSERLARSSLRRVINATGVVVHTNLGRSILAKRVIQKLGPLSGGYSNLEYDLEKGVRGSRYSHVEGILRELTSAEAAMVVNNNAAAVLVSLETLARGREVIVSRGELVEIGGSFRVPDVMKKSGARMVEIGTTNKTHLQDYEQAIGPDTALLLKVHRSNFQIIGFTEDVERSGLADLGNRYGLPLMEDLGSGCLVDLSKYGLEKEPTVQEVLKQGADLVTFSGDKLLGGPQAGIILGRKDLVEAIKRNQLTRALRIDKLTLLAMEETLKLYRDEQAAMIEIPTLRMISRTYPSIKRKTERLVDMIGILDTGAFMVDCIDGSSKVGGGALPMLELSTSLLRLVPKKMTATYIDKWLKSFDPPIIVRVEQDKVLLDTRTILDEELKTVARAINELASEMVL